MTERVRNAVAENDADRAIAVLLVEDNAGDAALVRAALADAGSFEIECVERLADANQRLGERRFDVVMLDLSLPDSSGLSTLTYLAAEIDDRPATVVITGLDDETIALKAVQAGAQDYVVKGQFEPRLLTRVLQSAIERHRMLRELDVAKKREHYFATHHPLTKLPNRYLFYDRLEQSIAQSRRNNKWLALLYLDLDRFKNINDTLGHDVGDSLLIEVARRISDSVRSSDTAAHLAGDEFTVILNGIAKALDAAKVAQSITDALARPLLIGGREISISASVGVAIFPTDGDSAELLIRNADTAMYQAKQEGRNGHRFYAPEMNTRARQRMELESDLRMAIERDELVLHYQPKIDGSTGQLKGSEALLRWCHRERGLVPPLEFIPLAEEIGMIRQIGDWVLHEACRQIQAWQREGLASLPVAVNASPKQFAAGDMAETVESSLRAAGIPGSLLEVEITESCLMADVDAVIRTLLAIKALDVRISLDDFGTGYSSLSVLSRLPLDTLKIDRTFINGCTTDDTRAMITSAIISLANNLTLDTVAEGVEEVDQLDFLIERNCTTMQGFLFSRPLEAQDYATVLRNGKIELPKAD